MNADDPSRTPAPSGQPDVTGDLDLPSAALDAGLAAAFGGDTTHLRPPAVEPEAGAVIDGKYRLGEKVGEGGMGSVWVAHQTEPVKRKVAVKLIKAGMDSKAVLARFDAERQALAVMDHPNIAKVLDGGVHAGRPYFVMELVKGVPITDFCDARKLTPRQRLELFVPVCQAIQHAHQKGVIHRDIKPSNVLVALYDDTPVPKVIDFGVAKATGAALTEHTLETGFGSVLGTPAYMSPEQATLNNLDVDTRSDVYSLGVLLYELLAGSPPFTRKDLEVKGLLEMLRVVREEEPPRPSHRLSTADALPSLSASRGTEPKKLTGLLRNELDWIVMKALEKDRGRRYDTANGFAADVLRYLSGEAVHAHPPTAGYRLKKFARKHRGPVLAGSLVLLALVLGVVGTAYGLVRAEERRAEADQAREREKDRADGEGREKAEKERQRAIAERAKEDAVSDRDRMRKAYAKTAEVLDAMVSGVTARSLERQKAVTPEQKKFLTEVLTYYREFAAGTGSDEVSRARAALAAWRVGQIEYRLGRQAEGLAAFERAREGYAKLSADFPASPRPRYDLGQTLNDLGEVLLALGRPDEAATRHREALAVLETLAGEVPGEPAYRHELSRSHDDLGLAFAASGEGAKAVGEHGKALAVRERLVKEFPKVAAYRHSLSVSHGNLAVAVAGTGDDRTAEKHYRKALEHQQALAVESPDEPEHRYNVSITRNNLGNLFRRAGKPVEGEGEFRRALEVQQMLAADYPTVPAYRRDVALARNNLAGVLEDQGRRGEAEGEHRTALAIREKLAAEFPTIPEYQLDVGRSYTNLGIVARDGPKPSDSLGWFEKAVALLRRVRKTDPRDVTATEYLRDAHSSRGYALMRLSRYAEAVADWAEAIALSPEGERPLLRANRAFCQLEAGQTAEAIAEVDQLRKLPGWADGYWYNFACCYVRASAKAADKRAEYADAAVEMLRQAVKAGYQDTAVMKSDPDLNPLRGRDDFKTLLADLEAKFPPRREVLPPPRADK